MPPILCGLMRSFFAPTIYRFNADLKQLVHARTPIKRNLCIRHPKDNGVLFLRAQNVRPLSIDLTSNPVYISEEDAERLQDNTIHYKDILITRSGANAGQCAIYLEDRHAISSSHTFIVQSGKLNPFFFAIFLNTKHGTALIEKGKYGSAQPEVAPYFLYQIPIPNWQDLQVEIEKTYLRSKDLTELSKTRYAEAQTLLLAELGLANWQPRHKLTFDTDYANMQRAERIDADYFQPKYGNIVNAIRKYPGRLGYFGKSCLSEKMR